MPNPWLCCKEAAWLSISHVLYDYISSRESDNAQPGVEEKKFWTLISQGNEVP